MPNSLTAQQQTASLSAAEIALISRMDSVGTLLTEKIVRAGKAVRS